MRINGTIDVLDHLILSAAKSSQHNHWKTTMDVISAIGLALTAIMVGPVISNSLYRLRRTGDLRKERE